MLDCRALLRRAGTDRNHCEEPRYADLLKCVAVRYHLPPFATVYAMPAVESAEPTISMIRSSL